MLDAIEEQGIEWRWYGPVLGLAVPGLDPVPAFNQLLGGDREGAVEGEYLEEALDWIESLGVDFHVPISAGAPEAAAAEELLNQRGLEWREARARFARETSRPRLHTSEAIAVEELTEFTEGFGHTIGRALDMPPLASFMIDCLPERSTWRCYWATEGRPEPCAYAAMMVEHGMVHLGFAATPEECRERGMHLALLRRRLIDAAECGCELAVAETRESLSESEPSAACRNLVRAGFSQVGKRVAWGPEPPDRDEEEDEPPEVEWEADPSGLF